MWNMPKQSVIMCIYAFKIVCNNHVESMQRSRNGAKLEAVDSSQVQTPRFVGITSLWVWPSEQRVLRLVLLQVLLQVSFSGLLWA